MHPLETCAARHTKKALSISAKCLFLHMHDNIINITKLSPMATLVKNTNENDVAIATATHDSLTAATNAALAFDFTLPLPL